MPDNICSVILAGSIICKCLLLFLKSSSYVHTWGLSHNCCLLLYNSNFSSCCKALPHWLFSMYVCTYQSLISQMVNLVLNKALIRHMFIFSKIPETKPWTTSVQSLLWQGLVKDWEMLNPGGRNLASNTSGQLCFQLSSMRCLERLCASCAICLARSRARSKELYAVPSSVLKHLFVPSLIQAQGFEINNGGWLCLWRRLICY